MSASLFWLERFGELRRLEPEATALRLRVAELERDLRRAQAALDSGDLCLTCSETMRTALEKP